MRNEGTNSSNIKWKCSCCGVEQIGLPMALAYAEPHNWRGIQNKIMEKSYLSKDFCIISHQDGDVERYIRCVLPFKIIDFYEQFEFGIWMSVSERSMMLYNDGFKSGEYAEPDCFGFLMHSLPGYDETWALECTVVFEPGNQRPSVYLNKTDHSLYHDQRNGLSLDYIKSLFFH